MQNGLKELLEKKYGTQLQQVEMGFIVPGLLTIIYEPEKRKVEERQQVLEKLATDVWTNPNLYKSLSDSWISTQQDPAKSFLQIQKRLAENLRSQPIPEVIEEGEYGGMFYIVSNDFFTEACI